MAAQYNDYYLYNELYIHVKRQESHPLGGGRRPFMVDVLINYFWTSRCVCLYVSVSDISGCALHVFMCVCVLVW